MRIGLDRGGSGRFDDELTISIQISVHGSVI